MSYLGGYLTRWARVYPKTTSRHSNGFRNRRPWDMVSGWLILARATSLALGSPLIFLKRAVGMKSVPESALRIA